MVIHGDLDRDRPAALFLVEASRGEDADCAVTPTAENTVAPDAPGLITVPAGYEPCSAPTPSRAHATARPHTAPGPVALR